MNLNAFKYCMRQTFVSLSRNRWLALVSAGMIAISLAILGGFLFFAINLNQAMQNIRTNLELIVLLDDHADHREIENRLVEHSSVTGCRFVSREDGLKEFGKTLGDNSLIEELQGEYNPLPDIFRVRAGETGQVATLAEEISGYPGVETVEYGEEIVSVLSTIISWINRVSLLVSALLAVGAVFLIVTTIRLSVMIRQEEIGIMKYLGAGDWFIRLPFLLEGLIIGWTGTLFSTVSMAVAYHQLASFLKNNTLVFFIQPVTAPEKLVPIFGGILLLGTIMGGLGSILSIRRFLKV